MADIVIVVYRPKPGQEAALLDLTRRHVPYLRQEGLATDRPAIIGRAADGSIVEVFEWGDGAIARAHDHPGLQAMWAEYALACDYATLDSLGEAHKLFASFAPIDL
jgi:hypothetical protein